MVVHRRDDVDLGCRTAPRKHSIMVKQKKRVRAALHGADWLRSARFKSGVLLALARAELQLTKLSDDTRFFLLYQPPERSASARAAWQPHGRLLLGRVAGRTVAQHRSERRETYATRLRG